MSLPVARRRCQDEGVTTSTNHVADPLSTASRQLIRTVDALPDTAWTEASLLPGWTRAHVAAHLALNAEGLAGALVGVLEGNKVPMYASDERRNGDIDELAAAEPTEIRDRLFGATTVIHNAVAALAAEPSLAEAVIERTPGSTRHFAAGQVAAMRLREVEIHHVDLGAGYSPAAWQGEFARTLIEDGARRLRLSERDLTLVATDLDRTWELGGGPTVSGPASGLAWWLTGRAPYPGVEVSSDDGVLPRIEGL